MKIDPVKFIEIAVRSDGCELNNLIIRRLKPGSFGVIENVTG
jgi:hypothetical protein